MDSRLGCWLVIDESQGFVVFVVGYAMRGVTDVRGVVACF